MCQSKSAGGQRCEYADMLATVRRTARRKCAKTGAVNPEKEVKKAVRKWQEENKEIVLAHLPKRQPFQVASNQKRVPEELTGMFTASSKEPITGFSKDERDVHTKALFEESEAWQQSLDLDERRAFGYYSGIGFEPMNLMSRRKGYRAWLKENGYKNDERMEEYTRRSIKNLDSALTKAPRPEVPRKLYRFFRVPAGVTPTEYLNRYFQSGDGFKDEGFMSTTADPEFIMAHMDDRNKGKRNRGYIVMEMVTKQGASLQPSEKTSGGHVQSLEKEVLLPRSTKFRIVEARRSQKFAFASDRDDLKDQYHPYGYEQHYRQGDEMSFPVVQMVDEELITEHHRNKKEKQ